METLFAQFISTSKKCKQELIMEVTRLGGETEEGTKTSGKFFRASMDVKAALTGKDRKAILNSCEYGEEAAQDTYDEALDNDLEHLSAEQQTIILAQKSLLRADLEHVKELLRTLVDA